VVLYELLKGRRPFGGENSISTMAEILHKEPEPISGPEELARLVARCLKKSPSERYQSATEVAHALVQIQARPSAQASIAVLPFADMSPGRDHDWFGDGVAEEIINALSHVSGLKVIARTSAFAFKGKHEDVRRIADALGVENVLEGSVRKAGNRVRVTAQLITAADGSHLWSERYDREMEDVFAIQDEIAQAITEALQITLGPKTAVLRRYAPNLPAYEALLRGRHQIFNYTPESWPVAKGCFERAIALDPRYAEPHASLGFGYLLMETNGIESLRVVAPLIRAEAKNALELDPAEPGPHFLLGAVAAAHDYDWPEAERQFRAALEADAVSADTRWAYASLYLQPRGRFQEAAAEMQRAVEQDPLNAGWRSIHMSHLVHAGAPDQALAEAPKVFEIDGNHWITYFSLFEAYHAKGMWAEALDAAEQGWRAAPWSNVIKGALAGCLARAGDKARAAELIRQMGDSPKPAISRVLYHILASEIEAAADWYQKSIEERELFALIFSRAPICSDLRQSARWAKLAKSMNLPA